VVITDIPEDWRESQLFHGQNLERNQAHDYGWSSQGVEDINPHSGKVILCRTIKFEFVLEAANFFITENFPQPTHKRGFIGYRMFCPFHFPSVSHPGYFTDTNVNIRKALVIRLTDELG
jgi:hypothetical protein